MSNRCAVDVRYHDCIVSAIPQIILKWCCIAAKDKDQRFKDFINMKNAVRESFTVIEPKPC